MLKAKKSTADSFHLEQICPYIECDLKNEYYTLIENCTHIHNINQCIDKWEARESTVFHNNYDLSSARADMFASGKIIHKALKLLDFPLEK